MGKERELPGFPADGTLTPLVFIRSRSSGGSAGLGREEGSWALLLLAWLLEAAGLLGLPVASAPNLALGCAGRGERRAAGGLAAPHAVGGVRTGGPGSFQNTSSADPGPRQYQNFP